MLNLVMKSHLNRVSTDLSDYIMYRKIARDTIPVYDLNLYYVGPGIIPVEEIVKAQGTVFAECSQLLCKKIFTSVLQADTIKSTDVSY